MAECMPDIETVRTVAEAMKQLGDPSRLRIFWLLCHCEECVVNIAAFTGMSSPAVSHHLRLLKQAGLVTSQRRGKEMYYRSADTPMADKLHHTYGERLITVAMHPASNPFTRGADKYDYTCPAADTYYLYMGGNATTPFPTGNIDMLAYDHDYLVDYSMWATLLAERMGEPASVQLAASALLKPASRQLTVRTRCFAIDKQDLQMAVWLVEDSIIGAQALPDGTVDTQYCHNHVLRAALSAEWGEPVTAQPQPEELIFDTALPEGCDAKHCSVVVVAMDQNKSIINAKQIKIE